MGLLNLFPIPVLVDTIKDEIDYDSAIEEVRKSHIKNSVLNQRRQFFGDATPDLLQPHQNEKLSFFNDQIKKYVNIYLKDYIFLECDNIAIQKSWAVLLKRQSSVSKHRHPNSHLSVVIYLKSYGNPLVLHSPEDHPALLIPARNKRDRVTIETKTGMIVIFPSSMKHSVKPHDMDYVRFCLTYDIMLLSSGSQENMMSDPSTWKIL